MFGSIISAVAEGVAGAVIKPIIAWWRDRSLINQGKQEQKAADDAATVKEDQNARRIEANDAELDRDALLRRLHEQSTSGH